MIKNNWLNKLRSKTMKLYLVALSTIFAATALIACFSSVSATVSPMQPEKAAGNETQFVFDIAYVYAGQGPLNASYTDAKGALMSPRSQNPSAVVFNITRAVGVQIESCDAEIEVYKVQINADTGAVENHCYFIGTNYSPSFSDAELASLFEHVNDLTRLSDSPTVRGNFEFNWTENVPFVSITVGSAGCYTGGLSGLGLWRAGTPSAISVTVHRIGYITMSNGSVSIYKDAPNVNATAATQLSVYGDGFLYNTLVPADDLFQTNLFCPAS